MSAFLSALFGVCSIPAIAASGVSVEFVARPIKPIGAYGNPSYTGHAYVILKWKLNSGIKEEVFGFYPATFSGKGIVKGPGLLRSEFRCAPTEECSKSEYAGRLRSAADTTVSSEVEISDAQYHAVWDVIKKWTTHEYDLLDANCINFLQDVAKASGYDPPQAKGLDRLPTAYVSALDNAIKAQNKLREEQEKTKKEAAERREAESQRDAAIEERNQAQKERDAALAAKKKAEAAAAAANSVPADWVACTCPSQHAGQGKVVNGTLWHPKSVPLCGG
ncbi:hypothetical protein [Paraburkholderia terrae]|uniref:hypothetical protein n=1 Tax=Paraburkholderia terrae TaxID=311230 RepID=UPI0020C157E4|nr:hypothetical protein [Paraburkholderia terrae]